MATDPEFVAPVDAQLSGAYASDERMAMLLGFESLVAPQPGEEIFVPGLEHQMPQPNAVNYGSSERSIAEVVYAFGYTAARLAYERKLLVYSPSRDADFDPFAPFCPPSMQDAIDAVHNASQLQHGKIRINAMGGYVLNIVLGYGSRPSVRIFDEHNGLGSGAQALENLDAIHAEREAYEQVAAERANAPTEPVSRPLLVETNDDLTLDKSAQEHEVEPPATFTLNDEPAQTYETLTPRQLRALILAAYKDGVDGYSAETQKVDIGALPKALRLVAMQNAIAAHLYPTGAIPDDAKLYSLEEAERLLASPEFDKKRGVVEIIGGISFNPRVSLLPVLGKNSLDVQLKAPGLTRNIIQAALALAAETGLQLVGTLEAPSSTDETFDPVEQAPGSPFDLSQDAEEAVYSATTPPQVNYEAVKGVFAGWIDVLVGKLPDATTQRAIFDAIASFDTGRDLEAAAGLMQLHGGDLDRQSAFKWVVFMRYQMIVWQQREQASQGSTQDKQPTFAARTGTRRRSDSVHPEPQSHRRHSSRR